MEWLLEAHKQIVKPLSQTCNHIWRAQECATWKSARTCAHGQVSSNSGRSRVALMPPRFPVSGSKIYCQKEQKILRRAQNYALKSRFKWTWATRLRHSRSNVVRTSLLVQVCACLEELSMWFADVLRCIGLPNTVACRILVHWCDSTFGFLSMLRMKSD